MPARAALPTTRPNPERSEERRVGKECRSRWSQYQLKKEVSRSTDGVLNFIYGCRVARVVLGDGVALRVYGFAYVADWFLPDCVCAFPGRMIICRRSVYL